MAWYRSHNEENCEPVLIEGRWNGSHHPDTDPRLDGNCPAHQEAQRRQDTGVDTDTPSART